MPPSAPFESPVTAAGPEAWHRLAFGYAPCVLGIEVLRSVRTGVVEVRVEHEIRSYQTPRVMRLDGLKGDDREEPAVGSRWIVATTHRMSDPRMVLTQLSDVPANCALATEWARPPWVRTPLLAVVRANLGRPRDVFEVDEVLRGPIDATRLVDNRSEAELFRPLVDGGALHLLAAWSVIQPHLLVDAATLTPITESELAELRRVLGRDPYATNRHAQAAARERLRELGESWAFYRAPLVAETRVGGVFSEATGAGGNHYGLAPERWLRGEIDLGTPVEDVQPSTMQFPLAWGAGPYLFHGGGHAYYGSERPGDRFLAGGHTIRGFPVARLEATPEHRASVHAWICARPPRGACLAVDSSAFAGRPPTHEELARRGTFEPDLDFGSLDFDVGRLRRVRVGRFEVVRRRTIELDDGLSFSWLHLRALADRSSDHGLADSHDVPSPEWMVAGVELPDWEPGSTWVGCVVDALVPEMGGFGSARTESTPWHDGRLMVWSTCVPCRDSRALSHVLTLMRRANTAGRH